MKRFPVTIKRRDSIGKVVTVSCSTAKDAIRILKRFKRSYRDVWIDDANGESVDEGELLNADAYGLSGAYGSNCVK
jgi:hypothetical protein